VQRPVEHQRDPRELLNRAVVQEERKPPPLVLFRRDQTIQRFVFIVGNQTTSADLVRRSRANDQVLRLNDPTRSMIGNVRPRSV
jgi:hypothetical protein